MKNLLRLLYIILMWPISWLLQLTIGLLGLVLIPRRERTTEVCGWYGDAWNIIRAPWNIKDTIRGI